MIKTSFQKFDIIALTALVLGGLSAVAYAQAALPSAPNAPSAPSAPMAKTLGAPAGGEVNVGAMDVTEKKAPENTAKVVLAPPPLPNESGDKSASIAVSPSLASASNDLPGLPTLNIEAPLPAGVAIESTGKVVAPSIPAPVAASDEPVKEVKKEKVATWTTTLAPAVTIPKLDYKYRREMLPEVIYSKSYASSNRHLPVAVTTDDYQRLFLMSVARNDIDATRAFLNRGMPVNTVNANGETALALAQRYGAGDTAQLLMLRGAR